MIAYLSLVTAWVSYFIQHPEKAAALWASVVAAYEAAQKLADQIEQSFETLMPREAGFAATADEEEAQREFDRLAGVTRGPFGNGKILRWLLTTPEGQALAAKLLGLISNMGS